MSIQSYSYLNENVPAARYYRAAAFTFPSVASTAVNPFIYDTKVAGFDPGNNYNTSTGMYTCPIAGLYLVKAQISIGATATGQAINAQVYQNGVYQLIGNIITPNASALIGQAMTVLACAAGDTINLAGQCNAASIPARANLVETNMLIVWMAAGAN
jgi:hypothetical protein